MTPRAALQRVRELELPGYGDAEVVFMAETIRDVRPSDVFEWGTNVGASARIFYEAGEVFSTYTMVHTFELPLALAALDRDHPGHRYAEHSGAIAGIKHYRGDGLVSALLLHTQLAPKRSLFFLDGCHEPGVVLHELEAIKTIAPQAAILVHDTVALTGQAVQEFWHRWGGHYRALEELPSQAGMVRLCPRPA